MILEMIVLGTVGALVSAVAKAVNSNDSSSSNSTSSTWDKYGSGEAHGNPGYDHDSST